VLEERDIQVRGYVLRLPLDLLLVASANPEDYTNRGRIITPLKDRFGAEVRTHYPLELDHEIDLIRQEARLAVQVPDFLLEVIARFTRHVRESPSVDARSGVSARFGVAAAESAAASALRRSALTGETPAVTRICDLPSVVDTLLGKVEFEADDEGREVEVLAHLLRRAAVETFRRHLGASDLKALIERFDQGLLVESGDLVPGRRLLEQIGPLPGLAHIMERLGIDEGAETPELAAAAVEFALEGLFLNRRISKDSAEDSSVVVYGSA
jgi:magnesium chelatase subunit I